MQSGIVQRMHLCAYVNHLETLTGCDFRGNYLIGRLTLMPPKGARIPWGELSPERPVSRAGYDPRKSRIITVGTYGDVGHPGDQFQDRALVVRRRSNSPLTSRASGGTRLVSRTSMDLQPG